MVPDQALVAFACAVLSLPPALCVFRFLPPPHLKDPVKTKILGRATFLTFQSNWIMMCYHALRFVRPGAYLAVHAFPLAFALGVGLTVNYYALDHFVPAKQAEDQVWIEKGWTWIPIGNHVQHGLALPIALLDATYGGHRGETTVVDVVLFVGGYTLLYLVWTLVNKKLTGKWVYPIFDAAEAKCGAAPGFLALCVPVVALYNALGYAGYALAG